MGLKVVVTGGASGIGLATCRAFLARGGRVAVADIDEHGLHRSLGEHAVPLRVDVRSTESVNAMIERATRELGGIDVLVNGAGVIGPSPSHELTDESWQAQLEVHLGGAVRCCRAAFPALSTAPAGAIVNVSSIAARRGIPQRLSYSAAKAAVEGVTRTLAVEWAPHGIRVNAVAPGYTRTPPVERALERGLVHDEELRARTPLGRLAEPAEIAAGIAFLASPEASYVTGHCLVIDGGMTIDG